LIRRLDAGQNERGKRESGPDESANRDGVSIEVVSSSKP